VQPGVVDVRLCTPSHGLHPHLISGFNLMLRAGGFQTKHGERLLVIHLGISTEFAAALRREREAAKTGRESYPRHGGMGRSGDSEAKNLRKFRKKMPQSRCTLIPQVVYNHPSN
jgi:hypothetical protein